MKLPDRPDLRKRAAQRYRLNRDVLIPAGMIAIALAILSVALFTLSRVDSSDQGLLWPAIGLAFGFGAAGAGTLAFMLAGRRNNRRRP